MSDNEDDKYEKWGKPCKCGDLKLGGYVILKSRPCRIISMTWSKTGKHGHSKTHLFGTDIFTERKYDTMSPTSHNLYVPDVIKQELQVVNVECENENDLIGTVEVFDGKSTKTLSLPILCDSDREVAVNIIREFDATQSSSPDNTVYVTLMCSMGEEHIKSCRVVKDAK